MKRDASLIPSSCVPFRLIPFLGVPILFSLSLCVFFPGAVALAADRDVCPACTYTTIQSAIDATSVGDRVRVATGTYNEHLSISSSLTLSGGWDAGFTRQSGDPSATIVDSGDTYRGIYMNPPDGTDITVESLTIQHGRTDEVGIWGAGLYVNAWDTLDVTIRNVVVQDCKSSLSAAGGLNFVTFGGSLSVKVENLVCRRNWANAVGGGLAITANDDSQVPGNVQVTITNSVFYGNTADKLYGGAVFISAQSKSRAEVTILNSTITGNTSNDTYQGGGGIYVADDTDPQTKVVLQVYNSILYGNTATPGADLVINTQGLESRTDVFFSDMSDVNDVKGTYNTGNNLATAPMFVNVPGNDYRLQRGSPAINTGTKAVPNPPGLPPKDSQGFPRVMGPAPDLGAYEYRYGILPTLSLLLQDS